MNPEDEPYYHCANNLGGLPSEFKKWRTLSEYRTEWNFLPYALRQRVAEQCMASDYLVSMDSWLNPGLTIGRVQKIVLIQSLSSIYEAVLGELVEREMKEYSKDPFFAKIYEKYPSRDSLTFGPILGFAQSRGIIDNGWASYLGQIKSVRNWTHLTVEQQGPLMEWVGRQSCAQLRVRLDDFRKFIRNKF